VAEARTQYAASGDIHLAYQVVGEGDVDLLLIDSWVHHVEIVWEIPEYARLLRRLGSFSRVIHFDRRGTGLSDAVGAGDLPDLATQVQDALAVLDAAGSGEAAVFGIQEGTLIAMLLAAQAPERCRSLILYSGSLGGHGWPEDQIDGMVAMITEDLLQAGGGGRWGEVPLLAPSRVGDPVFVEQFARLQRSSLRPAAVGHFFKQSMTADASDIAPSIQSPTLLLHRSGDQIVPVDKARDLAGAIPQAKLVELPGVDHLIFAGTVEDIADEIEEFLTGEQTSADPDRALVTLMFTDIVDSTSLASAKGDREWRHLLDRHHEVVRAELIRYGGREMATTGDGFMAVFDRPGKAVQCALAVVDAVGEVGLQVRAGVHTGEVEIRGSDLAGIAVHIAARVAGLAAGGEVLASGTVRDLLVGSGIVFEARGEHALKGVPERWRLFAVKGGERRALSRTQPAAAS
jgi:class 3 adenylate cyclase